MKKKNKIAAIHIRMKRKIRIQLFSFDTTRDRLIIFMARATVVFQITITIKYYYFTH